MKNKRIRVIADPKNQAKTKNFNQNAAKRGNNERFTKSGGYKWQKSLQREHLQQERLQGERQALRKPSAFARPFCKSLSKQELLPHVLRAKTLKRHIKPPQNAFKLAIRAAKPPKQGNYLPKPSPISMLIQCKNHTEHAGTAMKNEANKNPPLHLMQTQTSNYANRQHIGQASRRGFVLSSLGAMALSACSKEYPPFFDIEWDEEVLLHDGRVIWVHIKRTFQRLSKTAQWEGIHRDTEISFDAGGKIGRFTRKFERYDVDFLHEKNGYWYLGMGVTTGTPPVQLTTYEKSILLLKQDSSLTAFARAALPSDIKSINIMPGTPDSKGIAKFHNARLTIIEKNSHWQKYLRTAGDGPSTEINRK